MAMSMSMVRALGVGINTRSLSTKASRSHSQSPTIPKEITKAIKPSSSSSEFRKFLGIPGTFRSPNALLISKFLKLYTAQSPGIKKDNIWEDNLNKLLHGKDRVGLPEIAKLLSPQFNQKGGMNAESKTEDNKQHHKGGGKAKAKAKAKAKKKK
ncbi:SWIB/MDM2 domain protein [Fagus crenata]